MEKREIKEIVRKMISEELKKEKSFRAILLEVDRGIKKLTVMEETLRKKMEGKCT